MARHTEPGVPLRPRSGARETPRPVATQQLQLTVYLAARSLDGRPIEGTDLQRLKRGDKMVQWTRQALRHGRGNVEIDIDATEHGSSRLTKAAQRFRRNDLPNLLAGPAPSLSAAAADDAAVSTAFGAGVCDDFSRAAIARFAGGLTAQETLLQIKSLTMKHSWAELVYDCPPPEYGVNPANAACSITIDGWAQGPAVFRADRNLALYGGQTVLRARVDQQLGGEITQRALGTIRLIAQPDALSTMKERIRELDSQQWTWPATDVFSPSNALDSAFAARAQARMAHGPDGAQALRTRAAGYGAEVSPSRSLQGDIRTTLDARGHSLRDHLIAVSAARAMGANVAGAVQDAPMTLQAVEVLPEMLNPAPPSGAR